MVTFSVWYMKPETFRDGICGMTDSYKCDDLEDTHVHLKDVVARDMGDAWLEMQADVWSPNGEARGLIAEKGLQHTSMSVGDILELHHPEGRVFYVVSGVGFNLLGMIEK